jgi:hypothetical protein
MIIARIIHERFCCSRRYSALARESSFVKRRTEIVRRYRRRRDTLHEELYFSTNSHKSCGPGDEVIKNEEGMQQTYPRVPDARGGD